MTVKGKNFEHIHISNFFLFVPGIFNRPDLYRRRDLSKTGQIIKNANKV
jgi:hypothetical protein